MGPTDAWIDQSIGIGLAR